MIYRFIKITNDLYRGSHPNVDDVKNLSSKFGIKKIVSLDELTGSKIDRICKLLDIEHIMLPLTLNNVRGSLINLFSHNIKDMLSENGPVFVHCYAGKDRTGMLIAVYRCRYMGWSCEEALAEAKKLGFGIGIPADVVKLYKKMICVACKKKHAHVCTDENDADIVDQSRSEFTNSLMNTIGPKSFSPFLDSSKMYPYDGVYNSSYDQFPTRENYNETIDLDSKIENAVPEVGLYDSNSGIKGVGPVDNGGGFTAT